MVLEKRAQRRGKLPFPPPRRLRDVFFIDNLAPFSIFPSLLLQLHHLPPPNPYPTMAFILRRPFAIANALKQAPQASRNTIFRSFQQQTSRSFSQQSSRPLTKFAKNENVFLNAFRQGSKQRRYQSTAPANPLAQGNLTQRLIYGGMYTSSTVDHMSGSTN